MSFFVSVIIPVYNAERFIEKAILSVLEQQEVLEVIIVNDGSTDSSINIVKKLQEKEVKIKIFQHSNEINKGRSASRNLGIKNAKSPYIAFLDADDYFLPNRFKHDESIFKNIENCDGVYNAIGVHFYREASTNEFQDLELYSVKEITPPDELFKNLFLGGKGHFSIDGLTVKKTIFDKVGFFNESLAVAEDTELIWKMALKCQLITGQIKEAVAVRGVHDENVFNQTDLYKTYFFKLLESLLFWSVQNASLKQVDIILNRIWLIKYKEDKNLFLYIKYWSYLMAKQPKLICSILSIKYFPIIRLRKKLFPYLFR